ncbi:transposase, partial [Candidatus Poribacteria bacterium]
MRYKTHKITLDPTFKERRWFAQQCGYARFAYNHALSDFKAGLDADNFQSWQTLNDNFNKIKKCYDWTSSQDQRAALYAIKNLGQAITNWVSKRAKFPKFKHR